MNLHPYLAKVSSTLEILPDDADFEMVGGILIKPLRKIIAPFNVRKADGSDAYNSQQTLEELATKTQHLNLSWQLADVLESTFCVDRTQRDPAVNKQFFPFIKSNWYWTRDALAGSPSYAWNLGFGGGDSVSYLRGNDGFGLGVASLPASQ